MNDIWITDDMLASKGKRFANYIVDRIVFLGLFMGFFFALGYTTELTGGDTARLVYELENVGPIADLIISSLLYALFYFMFEGISKGRTIGKYITKTKVVDQQGNELTLNAYAARSISRIIPFEPLSCLGNTGRGWHDSLSNSFVIDIDKFERQKQLKSDLEALGQTQE